MKSSKANFNTIYLLVCIIVLLLAICVSFFLPKNERTMSWSDYLVANYITELAYDSGTGSSTNPYVISSAEQLASLAYNVNNGTSYSEKYFELGADIDLSSYSWVPIGNGYSFDGNFNGNAYRITGLYCNVTSLTYGGLFGFIYNANIDNVTIAGGSLYAEYAGAIAGYCYNSTISNCINISASISSSKYAGGIVGYMYGSSGKISECKNTANVYTTLTGTTGYGYAGGIIGYASLGTITKSYNNGSIICKQSNFDNNQILYAGGIAGRGTTITECYNKGAITAGSSSSTSTSYAGGITGYSGTISYCGNSGNIYSYSKQKKETKDISDSNAKLAFQYVSKYYYALEKNWKVSDANIIYTYTISAYAGGISGYTTISPTQCYNIGSITGGKQTKSCTFTYVYFYYDEPLSPSLSNWFGQFEASKIYFSYVNKYYYSPINGNTNLSISNCYGRGSYDYNVSGNFSCYSDIKQWKDAYYTPEFFYGNTWSSLKTYSSSNNTFTFDDSGHFGPVDDALQTHVIISKSGDTTNFTIRFRYYYVEYKNSPYPPIVDMYDTGSQEETGYRTADLYTTSFNNTVKYITKTNYEIKSLVGSGLSTSYWASNSLINNGYPFPKNLLWTSNSSSF